MTRAERIFRKKGIALCRFRKWTVTKQTDGNVRLTVSFRHACPCKDWKLDTLEFVASKIFSDMEIAYASLTLGFLKRYLKDYVRREGARHIREFLTSGTMDGARVQ